MIFWARKMPLDLDRRGGAKAVLELYCMKYLIDSEQFSSVCCYAGAFVEEVKCHDGADELMRIFVRDELFERLAA